MTEDQANVLIHAVALVASALALQLRASASPAADVSEEASRIHYEARQITQTFGAALESFRR